MKKYRIVKTTNGKYVPQIRKSLVFWDDIFYAGVYGLVEYSLYKVNFGSHNNRFVDTVEEAEKIIEAHKRKSESEYGEVIKYLE